MEKHSRDQWSTGQDAGKDVGDGAAHQWLSALSGPASDALLETDLQPSREQAIAALPLVRQQQLAQLLRVMIQVDLVDAVATEQGEPRWCLPLWRQRYLLTVDCSGYSVLAAFEQLQQLWLLDQASGSRRQIFHPGELLQLVARECQWSVAAEQRLASELSSSLANEALANSYRARWQQQLAHRQQESAESSLWQWVQKNQNTLQQQVFWEQWGAVGHPFHPLRKSKPGLSADEVVSFAPEFQPQVSLQWCALKRSLLTLETMAAESAEVWLQAHLGDVWCEFTQQLAQQGKSSDDYWPVALHPWQARWLLPAIGRCIGGDDLLALPQIATPAAPSMSFRTMVLPSGNTPHIKLPVNIQMTSATRTLSPRACTMGPRVSRLLTDIVQGDELFNGGIFPLTEPLGMYYRGQNNEQFGHQLSMLYRTNPLSVCEPDERAVPVAALGHETPLGKQPLLVDIIQSSGRHTAAMALRYFENYCRVLLHDNLLLYLRYGIALEPHQQNTLAVFDVEGQLQRFLIRDFGSVRIYLPHLVEQGFTLQLHQDPLIVAAEFGSVRRKFIHALLICHLGELVTLLSRFYQIKESDFWRAVRQGLVYGFAALREHVPAERWRRERYCLLQEAWQVKGLLQMRMEDTVASQYCPVDNPLADLE